MNQGVGRSRRDSGTLGVMARGPHQWETTFKLICGACGSENTEVSHERADASDSGTVEVQEITRCLDCGHEHKGKMSASTNQRSTR